jgi:hypothetical protein
MEWYFGKNMELTNVGSLLTPQESREEKILNELEKKYHPQP